MQLIRIIRTGTTDTIKKGKRKKKNSTGKSTMRFPPQIINLKKHLPTKWFGNMQKNSELVILTS